MECYTAVVVCCRKMVGAVDVIRLTFVKKCAQMTGGGIRPRSEVGRWTAKS